MNTELNGPHACSDCQNCTGGPILVFGFAATVAMWLLGFITHHPAVGAPPVVAGPFIMLTFVVAMFLAGRAAAPRRGWVVGLGAGLLSALLNLLVLGSFLAEPSGQNADGGSILAPSAPLAAAGFLALGAGLGAVVGAIGQATSKVRSRPRNWRALMAMVCAASVLPLLLVGGSVTSTESGLAVPDWPATYGSNMFLYPIGLMTRDRIFLEHAHRLFGSLVGLTTLATAVIVMRSLRRGALTGLASAVVLSIAGGGLAFASARSAGGPPQWLNPALIGLGILAAAWTVWLTVAARPASAIGALFGLVVVQGVFGGLRVTEQSTLLAVVHGVLAQIVFACAVGIAASLIQPFCARPDSGKSPRRWANAAAVCVLAQIVFGAIYRHMGSSHALWTHVGFAHVVVVLNTILGYRLIAVGEKTPSRSTLRVGKAMQHPTWLQYGLGWLALVSLMMVSQDRGGPPTADQLQTAIRVPVFESVATTAHQFIGAVVIGATGLALVWTRRPNCRCVPGTCSCSHAEASAA